MPVPRERQLPLALTQPGGAASPAPRLAPLLTVLFCLLPGLCTAQEPRPRVIIETDAGGDPDDEQSLVRFLVYANEWDIEGIIANRPRARDGENKNPERTGHGPLGALYPTNTGLPQKEGDTMTLLYLVPTGMNDPNEPTWGSWAGRYGPNEQFPGKAYYWANQRDTWQGTTSRDNTLARWAVALQNDFRARMDWCATGDFKKGNHPPLAVLNGDRTKAVVHLRAKPGDAVTLSSQGSTDPDGNSTAATWFVYREAGTFSGEVKLTAASGETTEFVAPRVERSATIHVILQLEDDDDPHLFAYRRAVITIQP